MGIEIQPEYGDAFDTCDLIAYIRSTGRNYIVQGQQICKLQDHTKPNSLDVWMRKQGDPAKANTKQADNKVIADLVGTGKFRGGLFTCPDSGRSAKGIEVI